MPTILKCFLLIQSLNFRQSVSLQKISTHKFEHYVNVFPSLLKHIIGKYNHFITHQLSFTSLFQLLIRKKTNSLHLNDNLSYSPCSHTFLGDTCTSSPSRTSPAVCSVLHRHQSCIMSRMWWLCKRSLGIGRNSGRGRNCPFTMIASSWRDIDEKICFNI